MNSQASEYKILMIDIELSCQTASIIDLIGRVCFLRILLDSNYLFFV